MEKFTQEVINIISSIPIGKVMTYGQIAFLAGNPWGARQVSRVLHSMSKKYGLPWHRVVNSKGQISLSDSGFHQQKILLIEEGVVFKKENLIDLSVYLHEPF